MAKQPGDAHPVLFVLIGWARYYDGTETVVGAHRHLQAHPDENGEVQAFVRHDDGYFRCGVGVGELHESATDIAFVARNPTTMKYEVVCLYRACTSEVSPDVKWCTAKTKQALLFAASSRPACPAWPAGQGMRRWARRIQSKGCIHPRLLAVYKGIANSRKSVHLEGPDTDPELSSFEGTWQKRFVVHRKREAALRAAKIRETLQRENGHLICEVANCRFNFLETYGEIGRHFAHVHHLLPLSRSPRRGFQTSLSNLAIVCANCHAMIHRGGGCRKLSSLIPSRK